MFDDNTPDTPIKQLKKQLRQLSAGKNIIPRTTFKEFFDENLRHTQQYRKTIRSGNFYPFLGQVYLYIPKTRIRKQDFRQALYSKQTPTSIKYLILINMLTPSKDRQALAARKAKRFSDQIRLGLDTPIYKNNPKIAIARSKRGFYFKYQNPEENQERSYKTDDEEEEELIEHYRESATEKGQKTQEFVEQALSKTSERELLAYQHIHEANKVLSWILTELSNMITAFDPTQTYEPESDPELPEDFGLVIGGRIYGLYWTENDLNKMSLEIDKYQTLFRCLGQIDLLQQLKSQLADLGEFATEVNETEYTSQEDTDQARFTITQKSAEIIQTIRTLKDGINNPTENQKQRLKNKFPLTKKPIPADISTTNKKTYYRSLHYASTEGREKESNIYKKVDELLSILSKKKQ